jgi:Protein of unknown function (DUF4242)
MREFVAEQYLPATAASASVTLAGVARRAAEQLACEGTQVRFVRSIFIPQDETCLHFYLAESAEAVQVAAARASLRLERVAEAVSWLPDEATQRSDIDQRNT